MSHLIGSRAALMPAAVLAAAALTAPLPAYAQPATSAPENVATQPATQPAAFVGDEQGAAILDAALAHMENLDTLAVKITTKMHVKAPGMVQDMDSTNTVSLAAPNRLAIRPDAGPAGMPTIEIVSDGESLWAYGSMFNRYTQQPAPATFADWESDPAMAMSPGSLFIPALTNPTAVREALAGFDESIVAYVGAEQLDGEAVHRLRLGLDEETVGIIGEEDAPAGLNVDVWVSAGDVPWVRKVVPDMEGMFEAAGDKMPPHMKDMTFEMAITFADWASPDAFPADTFAFVAPDGAELVDDLFGAPPAPEVADGGDAEEEDAEALVGQPAPAFALPTLAGDEQVALADLQGQIVVLDFWATWCPPCVKGLPKVSAATAAFADQGVVFFALNQQEDAPTVNAFLKAKKLEHLAVLMDDGSAAQAYRVSDIPQTVVIDRAGVVRAVHIGFGPGGENQVTADIQAILATDVVPAD